MRQSTLFLKTKKKASGEAKIASHKLLLKADCISQLASGIYSYLPLGYRVHKKIEKIIREELDAIGGQEVFLPTLQPKELWQKSNRWDNMNPPLFKLKDRRKRSFALGPTHEEVITDLVKDRVQSYKDLPFSLYQIQNKFRDELRATGGLLRAREFVMKDLYSFHRDAEDLSRFFKKVILAYKKIYKRCGLNVLTSEASGEGFTEQKTYEFQVLSEVGEDKIIYCPVCGWAANLEMDRVKAGQRCPNKDGKLVKANSIEVGHTFKLGTKYSEAFNLYFTDKDGEKKPVEMGCYGIGIGRLMATIVQVNYDDLGIIWPLEVAPFLIHLVQIENNLKVRKEAEKLYNKLKKEDIEVLYDDRKEKTPGEKFADVDLIGIPLRIVVSEKTMGEGSFEVKSRSEKKTKLIKKDKLISFLEEYVK